MNHRIGLVIVAFIFSCALSVSTFAQEKVDSLCLNLLFRQNETSLDVNFQDNEANLSEFLDKVGSIRRNTGCEISSISITASSSPEGSFWHNLDLSAGRAASTRDYLKEKLNLPESVFELNALGENWVALREIVEGSEVPDKEKILEILNRYSDYVNGRPTSSAGGPKKELMDLNGGKTWFWLLDNVFPELRGLSNKIVCRFASPAAGAESTEATSESGEEVSEENEAGAAAEPVSALESLMAARQSDKSAENDLLDGSEEETSTGKEFLCPPFALKTNLLFDAALALNGEIEIPLGPRVSLAAEWCAPWWLAKDNRFCYEANMANIEARWWWGDRSVMPMLSGLFTGIYYGNGKYDLQNSKKGRQGIYSNVGVGAGYAWSLGGNWGLEAMAGLGLFNTWSELYIPRDNYTVLAYKQTQTTAFFGPTRAKVSIYYKFGQKLYDRKYRNGNE